MSKHYALNITVIFVVAATIIFSGQMAVGQTGTAAGGHNEIVKRLQDKLVFINNEVLTKEISPILDGTGEADLGAKLLESFLSGVTRMNRSLTLFDNLANVVEASRILDGCLNEIDYKATLLQVYYDALSPEQRTNWTKTGPLRMNTITKPVVDNLLTRGFERPARHIESYKTICFKCNEDILNQLQKQNNNNRLETMLEEAAKASAASRPRGDYGNSNMEMMGDPMLIPSEPPMEASPTPREQEKPAELSLIQQVEALAMGTAVPKQVMPLCQLLAASIDSMLANKKDELAKLRHPFGRGGGMGGGFGGNSSDFEVEFGGPPMSPMPTIGGFSGSSFLSNTVTPLPQVNVAGYLNSEIRMCMSRNLKPMILETKNITDIDTLIKAWCALSEGAGFSDVYYFVLTEAAAHEVMPNSAKYSYSWIEMLSTLSGYKSDYRIWSSAVGMSTVNQADLSIQMCYNIGKEMMEPIRNSLTSPEISAQAKVTLIEAAQYIGDPDAAAFLIPLLVSDDRAIVTAAADTIAAVGDRRASAALVKGLGNPRLADTIVGILKRMGTTSSQDIIPMFKEGNLATDKFCVDILAESGDINTLYYLAAVLERYHIAPSTKDMSQAEKSEMLMLTMQAGTAIISRNMSKAPPSLTVPTAVIEDGVTRLDYTPRSVLPGGFAGLGVDSDMGLGAIRPGVSAMGTGMGSDMPSVMPERDRAMSSGNPGSTGMGSSSETATVVPLEQMLMQREDLKNNAPAVWLDRIYKVAARHIDDTAKRMEGVLSLQAEAAGRKLGRDFRNERIDKDFFTTVINTSEEGLSAYLILENGRPSGDVRKLNEQKDRVIRSMGIYQRQVNRMSQSAKTAYTNALTGTDPNASVTGTDGLGSGVGGTTRPATPSPLGRRL